MGFRHDRDIGRKDWLTATFRASISRQSRQWRSKMADVFDMNAPGEPAIDGNVIEAQMAASAMMAALDFDEVSPAAIERAQTGLAALTAAVARLAA
jgi:hypothetical protein